MIVSKQAISLLILGVAYVDAQVAGVNPEVTIGTLPTTTKVSTTPDPDATQATSFDSKLVGTWSSKSNKTFTGPGFYDPKNEEFIEPSRTGISYSFTKDGHYEMAYYRAIANPQNPACPAGIMQWQHGKYNILQNGSIVTQPIKIDGRQLLSDPCNYETGIYTRWNQSELFERYEQYTDPYHDIPRLNLFRFDGSPVMPLYLAYRPPQMLPTTTLSPSSATSSNRPASSTGSSKVRRRRELEDLNTSRIVQGSRGWILGDLIWWFGVGSTGLGALMFFCF